MFIAKYSTWPGGLHVEPTDIRVSKTVKASHFNAQVIADVFNIFNSNTELVRGRNAAAASFDQLAQNLSPRILRLGVRIGF